MKTSNNRPDISDSERRRINQRFRQEVEAFGFVYRCEHCVHVVKETVTCVLGYPNDMLADGEVRALDGEGHFVFCKDFELEG